MLGKAIFVNRTPVLIVRPPSRLRFFNVFPGIFRVLVGFPMVFPWFSYGFVIVFPKVFVWF